MKRIKIDYLIIFVLLFLSICITAVIISRMESSQSQLPVHEPEPPVQPIEVAAEPETPPEIEEPEEIPPEKEEPQEEWKSLGPFVLTAYCPCAGCSGPWGNSTATGATATEGITIAVDPTVIPYGSKIKIRDHVYIAQDTGGAIKGKIIDIYFDSHADTDKFGRQMAEVYILTTP